MDPTNGGNLYPNAAKSVQPSRERALVPAPHAIHADESRRATAPRPHAIHADESRRATVALRAKPPVTPAGNPPTAAKAARHVGAPAVQTPPKPRTEGQQNLRQFAASRLGREANKGLLGALDQ
jgi:hypothetical protein